MSKIRIQKLFCVIFLVIVTVNVLTTYAGAQVYVFINDVKTENSLDIKFDGLRTEIPLRDFFESLGADVEWMPENGDVEITYNTKVYRCIFFGEDKMYILDEAQGKFLSLYSGPVGKYKTENGKIYLDEITATKFIEAVGISFEFDAETMSVNIYTSVKPELEEKTEVVTDGSTAIAIAKALLEEHFPDCSFEEFESGNVVTQVENEIWNIYTKPEVGRKDGGFLVRIKKATGEVLEITLAG